jgi:hypothetical protein
MDFKNKKRYIKDQYEQHTNMKFQYDNTPMWITNLIVFNVYEQNLSVMHLDELVEKYLGACNYEHIDNPDEDELINDDFDPSDVPTIKYRDIIELNRTEAEQLRKMKIDTTLTKLQELQLVKYYFQCMLTDKDIWQNEILLWDIYINYGKMRFRNLAYEKGVNMGTIRIQDMILSTYTEISSTLSLRVELINAICIVLGLKHSQDYSKIPKKTIENSIKWFQSHSAKIHTAFDIRNQKNIKEYNLKTTTRLINKVFAKWGFSKVVQGEPKKVRIEGKQVNVADYKVENTSQVSIETFLDIGIKDEKEIIKLKNANDVYDKIKPKKSSASLINTDVVVVSDSFLPLGFIKSDFDDSGVVLID